MGSPHLRGGAAALVIALALAVTGCGGPGAASREPELDPTLTTAAHAPIPAEWRTRAQEQYRDYVVEHAVVLQALTADFADAVLAGDDDSARALYLEARHEWHRIRPAAMAMTDLGIALDAQRTELGAQEEWTGWHRFEADLWPASGHEPLTPAERERLAIALIDDTQAMIAALTDPGAVFAPEVTAALGARLIESLLQSSLAGTAEPYSRANLLAARAQAAGARAAIESVETIARERDAQTTDALLLRLAALETLLAGHAGELDELTPNEVRDLAHAADALAEPLARLASLVVDR